MNRSFLGPVAGRLDPTRSTVSVTSRLARSLRRTAPRAHASRNRSSISTARPSEPASLPSTSAVSSGRRRFRYDDGTLVSSGTSRPNPVSAPGRPNGYASSSPSSSSSESNRTRSSGGFGVAEDLVRDVAHVVAVLVSKHDAPLVFSEVETVDLLGAFPGENTTFIRRRLRPTAAKTNLRGRRIVDAVSRGSSGRSPHAQRGA